MREEEGGESEERKLRKGWRGRKGGRDEEGREGQGLWDEREKGVRCF